MKQIAVIGEAMLELSHRSDTTLALSFAGDTLNFAIYLRRLLPAKSFNIHYVTALGCDSYSDSMLKNWQEEGLDTDLVCRLENKLPGLYLIRTDEEGERTFYFYRQNSAARELFKSCAMLDLEKNLLAMDYLYLSGITLAILDESSREYLWGLLENAKQKGVKIIFDTNYRASLWEHAKSAQKAIEQTLKWVDVVLPTFVDEQALFGDATPEACVQRLLKNRMIEVVVKCGAEPVLIATMGMQKKVPARPIEKAVDTTGAGDSFNAAYLAARLLDIEPIKAAQWGHQLASTVIAYPGAIIPREAMPDLRGNYA